MKIFSKPLSIVATLVLTTAIAAPAIANGGGHGEKFKGNDGEQSQQHHERHHERGGNGGGHHDHDGQSCDDNDDDDGDNGDDDDVTPVTKSSDSGGLAPTMAGICSEPYSSLVGYTEDSAFWTKVRSIIGDGNGKRVLVARVGNTILGPAAQFQYGETGWAVAAPEMDILCFVSYNMK